jgi:hypothetical protein
VNQTRLSASLGLEAFMPHRFAAAFAVAVLAAAQTGPAGHWEGSFSVNGRDIALSFDLARNAKAEWIASMGLPAQKMEGLVVSELSVGRDSVSFVGVELMMTRFDLTLDPSGSLKGKLTGRQGSLPIEFKRTGEGAVKLAPPSPAVSKDLEGDWAGTLDAGGRAFPLVIHFRNRPDNTVAATIDSPDRDASGLPLDNVKQSGREVAFGVKIAHGSFAGKLNAEGTELVGTFTHEQGGLPLTLRKK